MKPDRYYLEVESAEAADDLAGNKAVVFGRRSIDGTPDETFVYVEPARLRPVRDVPTRDEIARALFLSEADPATPEVGERLWSNIVARHPRESEWHRQESEWHRQADRFTAALWGES